jgi:hypothetical protein
MDDSESSQVSGASAEDRGRSSGELRQIEGGVKRGGCPPRNLVHQAPRRDLPDTCPTDAKYGRRTEDEAQRLNRLDREDARLKALIGEPDRPPSPLTAQ